MVRIYRYSTNNEHPSKFLNDCSLAAILKRRRRPRSKDMAQETAPAAASALCTSTHKEQRMLETIYGIDSASSTYMFTRKAQYRWWLNKLGN